MHKEVNNGVMYIRVGSEKQLNDVRKQRRYEEENMKRIAYEFMKASERYEKLTATERSLIGQVFAEQQRV